MFRRNRQRAAQPPGGAEDEALRAAIAASLGARKLVWLTAVEGVLEGRGRLVSELSPAAADLLHLNIVSYPPWPVSTPHKYQRVQLGFVCKMSVYSTI